MKFFFADSQDTVDPTFDFETETRAEWRVRQRDDLYPHEIFQNPTMRPWTVTVLSDYGRDRLTYQTYDRLFDPILRPHTLPVRNRYVLRMQAAFAVLDWLAVNNIDLPGWWWEPIKGPVDREGLWHKQQARTSEVLAELLAGPGPRRQALSDHVHHALRLNSQEEAGEILWGAPRSLLLEVLPTLARRLETN